MGISHQLEKFLEQENTFLVSIQIIMVRSNSRNVSINSIGSHSSMNRISNSSYTYHSNNYSTSTSSHNDDFTEGDCATASNSSSCQQTLLERRLGSSPEINNLESTFATSSNGVRPRKLKIGKGKDRIIPVQYVRRHSSNSDCISTPEVTIEEKSSKNVKDSKISSLENVDSLNILQFLPIISSRSQ